MVLDLLLVNLNFIKKLNLIYIIERNKKNILNVLMKYILKFLKKAKNFTKIIFNLIILFQNLI